MAASSIAVVVVELGGPIEAVYVYDGHCFCQGDGDSGMSSDDGQFGM